MDPFAKMINDLADAAVKELGSQFVGAQGDVLNELAIGHTDHANEIRARMREAYKTLDPVAQVDLMMHILECYGDALDDLMTVQPFLFRMARYLEEIDRVDAAGGLKYGEDVHVINDIPLRRADLKGLVDKLGVPTITEEDIAAYEERQGAPDLT